MGNNIGNVNVVSGHCKTWEDKFLFHKKVLKASDELHHLFKSAIAGNEN